MAYYRGSRVGKDAVSTGGGHRVLGQVLPPVENAKSETVGGRDGKES
jgi:hypothetical protein